MKKCIFFVLAVLCMINAKSQIKISDLSTYAGNPAGAIVPIVLNGVNRKIDASYFGYTKVDSASLSNDTLFFYKHGSVAFYKKLPSLSVTNGLTKVGQSVKLGGTLTENTDLNLSGYDLSINGGDLYVNGGGLELAGGLAARGSGVQIQTDVTRPFGVIRSDSVDAADGNHIIQLPRHPGILALRSEIISLPFQGGNTGKFLQTNGTLTSWQTISSGNNVDTSLLVHKSNNENISGIKTFYDPLRSYAPYFGGDLTIGANGVFSPSNRVILANQNGAIQFRDAADNEIFKIGAIGDDTYSYTNHSGFHGRMDFSYLTRDRNFLQPDTTGTPVMSVNGISPDSKGRVNISIGSSGEPIILSGTTSQYWRGDKTWQDLTFASLGNKPTTLTGYGITDAYPLTGNPSSFLAYNTFPVSSVISTTAGDKLFAFGNNIHYIYSGTSGWQLNNQSNTASLFSIANNGNANLAGTLTVGAGGADKSIVFGGTSAGLYWGSLTTPSNSLYYNAGNLYVSGGSGGYGFNVNNTLTAGTIVKAGGLASQFLKADGSVDANVYSLTSHTHTFSSLTGIPSTIAGYGITDAYPLTGNPSGFLTSVPAQSFSSLTGKPTTIAGYGITDAFILPSQTGNSGKVLQTNGTNATWQTVSGIGGSSLDTTLGDLRYQSYALNGEASLLQKVRNSDSIIISCQGTSITFGLDTQHPSGDVNNPAQITTPYPTVLQSILNGLGWKTRAINRGVAGALATDGLTQWANASQSDIVFIEYGTNEVAFGPTDTLPANRLSDFKAAYKKIVKKRLAQGSYVVLLAPTHSNDISIESGLKSIRRIVQQIGFEESVPVLSADSGFVNNYAGAYIDNAHLSNYGSSQLATNIANFLVTGNNDLVYRRQISNPDSTLYKTTFSARQDSIAFVNAGLSGLYTSNGRISSNRTIALNAKTVSWVDPLVSLNTTPTRTLFEIRDSITSYYHAFKVYNNSAVTIASTVAAPQPGFGLTVGGGIYAGNITSSYDASFLSGNVTIGTYGTPMLMFKNGYGYIGCENSAGDNVLGTSSNSMFIRQNASASIFIGQPSRTNLKIAPTGEITYYTASATPATPPSGSVVEWFDGTNKRWKKSDGSTGIIY